MRKTSAGGHLFQELRRRTDPHPLLDPRDRGRPINCGAKFEISFLEFLLLHRTDTAAT